MSTVTKTDGFIDHRNAFDFEAYKTRNYKLNPIQEKQFFKWSKQNLYRSTYINHYTDKPAQPKNVAPPKYGGYIPFQIPENIHAKGYSPITRDVFAHPQLNHNPFGLASTGFNYKKEVHLDQSKDATTSTFGKSQIILPHPSWRPKGLISTTHDSFKNPMSLVPPTFRVTQKYLNTLKFKTKVSGFSQNHDTFDVKGWKPHPVLNANRDKTEYRNRFNLENAPYHRETMIFKERKLPMKQIYYKFT